MANLMTPAAMNGTELLNDVLAFYCRFVAFPSENAAVACTLWAAHTHAMDAWDSTPRLAFLSPEPGSGKTRALEVTELLVPRPVEAVNVTPAYLFRKVAAPEGRPTILHDEIDTVFGAKVRRDVEETRGLLNAGHRKGAVTGRCKPNGKTVETEEIEAYCAVALAGLGDLPDTVASRAVIIRMRRRAPGETVEAYRRRVHAPDGDRLCERLARWAEANEPWLVDARPEMPPGIEDRPADVWEPLLAVADAAGGDWPSMARAAAVALVAEAAETPASLGVRLLADIRTALGEAEQMATKALLEALNQMDEAPWGELGGRPLTDRRLAQLLSQYQVRSRQIRPLNVKGYRREDLWDAFQRYLSPPSQVRETSETTDARACESDAPAVSDVSFVSGFGVNGEADGGWIGEKPVETRARLSQVEGGV